jgi:lipid A ethanolaminephosphotransferase
LLLQLKILFVISSLPKNFFSRGRFQIEILAVVIAAYCSIFLNNSLWTIFIDSGGGIWESQRWIFILSAFIGITAFQVAFLSIFIWGRFAKFFGVVIVLICALTNYFSNQYKVVFDTTMIQNVLATNLQESRELFSLKVFFVILIQIAPVVVFLYFYRPQKLSILEQISAKIVTILTATSLVVVVVFSQYQSLASVVRNNLAIRHVVLPTSPIVAFFKSIDAHAKHAGIVRAPLDLDPNRLPQGQRLPLLMVVVVGETVRAQNWGLSGYARQTTPMLSSISKNELFNFPYAKSCGTSTEISVPCMFSGIGRSQYDEDWIKSHESVLPLLKRAGVHVTWIDNQSGCKGTCDGVESFDAKSFFSIKIDQDSATDELLLKPLDTKISEIPKDQIIVLHMMGNHGPAYYKRYPKNFEKFTPVCQTSNLSSCSSDSIINAYDNAIIYTDFILASIIKRLGQINDRLVSVVYTSDHGESLGEHGIYLHGLPYLIAPEEQKQVPFFFWFPKKTQKALRLDTQCLSRKASQPTEHDMLAHTFFGLYQISTKIANPEWNFIHDCIQLNDK